MSLKLAPLVHRHRRSGELELVVTYPSAPPHPAVALLNLLGSLLFLVASCCYFFDGAPERWRHGLDLWGVRFTFAVGSACFLLGAIVSLPEVLTDS